ncbi:MAG: alpha/beta fold hydrolase [Verrucomicrobiales bacterium]|nr:alpha/beta fold hydrolase [Verrucomicrobiales bacterium]
MRLLLRVGMLGLMVYGGLVVLVTVFQRRLLYLPDRIPTGDLALLARAGNFQPWTNAAGQRVGWWRPSSSGKSRGCALITHGNSGSAVGRDYLANPIQEAFALDVYILEYPGYGDRPGSPTQESLLAAAKEAAGLLAGRTNLFLVGESLGTGVASYLASELGSTVSGVLLMVPYNRMTDAAASHYGWLPVRWLLRDRYPSAEWLPRYGGPVAFLVAGSDHIVPSRLGQALYDAYPGRKRIWVIPGADHEDVLAQPASWWEEVGAFWGLPGTAAHP